MAAAASDTLVATCQAELKRNFRQDFDADLVRSLLEMNNNDVRAVITFMTAGPGEPEPYQPPADGIPKDYFKKPKAAKKSSGVKNAESSSKRAASDGVRSVFLQDSTFNEHVTLQLNSYPTYVSTLLLLVKQKVEINAAVKGRVLAACLARRDLELAQHLLQLGVHFYGLPEVLKAVTLLDAPRRMRAANARLQRLQRRGTAKGATLGALLAHINELRVDQCTVSHPSLHISVSSAVTRLVKGWVRGIPPSELTFYALSLPKEPWKQLADIIHLRSDEFQLPWFLNVAFGAAPPEDSVVAKVATLDWNNLVPILRQYELPYSYIRRSLPEGVSPDSLSNDVKAELCRYEDMGRTVIWWYEDLACPEADVIIRERLERGDFPDLGYGKLMERLMLLQSMRAPFWELLVPLAERRMKEVALPLESPVVVVGDASFSMDVAIRTATIISAILCYLANADLCFFNSVYFAPKIVPRSIMEVLDTAKTVKADGLTAPAAALRHFYDRKEKVNVMVMVTDEIENVPYEGDYFAQLFYRYYHEVHPCKLVFVSFLDRTEVKGRMVRALEEFGFAPLQFRLDQTRPDLTKLDALIGVLASETSYFEEETEALAAALSKEGLAHVNRFLASNNGPATAGSSSSSSSSSSYSRGAGGSGTASTAAAATSSVSGTTTNGDESLCRVCLDLPNDYAIVPCGHQVLCEQCRKLTLEVCPLCRTRITSVIKIFKV